jgi:uncharacterized protein YfiM (DUF2279 family)
MIRILALTLALHAGGPVPGSPWFGADKVKHFLMSAFVQSATFAVARSTGMNRGTSQIVAGVASGSVGIWKELYDRKAGKPFSVSDLVWDAAGATSAGALLNRSR